MPWHTMQTTLAPLRKLVENWAIQIAMYFALGSWNSARSCWLKGASLAKEVLLCYDIHMRKNMQLLRSG